VRTLSIALLSIAAIALVLCMIGLLSDAWQQVLNDFDATKYDLSNERRQHITFLDVIFALLVTAFIAGVCGAAAGFWHTRPWKKP
jgi:ribose/xylose/arabinose/galactoside ABC-type transport system permease subunit